MTERLRLGRTLLLPTLVAFLLLFAPCGRARAAWRTAGDVKSVERTRGGVVLVLTSGARVSVGVVRSWRKQFRSQRAFVVRRGAGGGGGSGS